MMTGTATRASVRQVAAKPPRTPLQALSTRNSASVARSPSLRAAATESPLLSRSAERELLRQLGQLSSNAGAPVGGSASEGGTADVADRAAASAELGVQAALSRAAEAAADADADGVAAEVSAQQRAEAEVERIQAAARSEMEQVAGGSAVASAEERIVQVQAVAQREVEEARARATEEARAAQAEAEARVAAAAEQVEQALAQAEHSALVAREGSYRAAEEQAELQRQIDARAAALASQAAERIAEAHAAAEGCMALAAEQAEQAILERAQKAEQEAASTVAAVEQEASERVERVRKEAALQAATYEEQLAGAHALAAQATEQCDGVVRATDAQIAELRQMCAVVQQQAEVSREAARVDTARAVEEVNVRSSELAAKARSAAAETDGLKLSLRQLEAQSSVQLESAQERGDLLVRETELMMMRLMQAWANRRTLLDVVRAWRICAESVAARRAVLQHTARRLQEFGMRRVMRSWAANARRLRQHSMAQWQRRLHEQLTAERAQSAGERSEAMAMINEASDHATRSQLLAEEMGAAAEAARVQLAQANAFAGAAKLESDEAALATAEASAAQGQEMADLKEQLAAMHAREQQWENATAAAISAGISDATGNSSAGHISKIRPLDGSSFGGDDSHSNGGSGISSMWPSALHTSDSAAQVADTSQAVEAAW